MKAIMILSMALLSGCASHAGPFVTNVSPDGRGGINVEKCSLKYDRMIAVVENEDCKTTNIVLPK